MTKRSTKRALLMSALAIIMCVSMLVGTTFAWFTDSVTSSGNKIVAGKLDVDLLMGTAVDTYHSIANQNAAIFGANSLVAQNNPADTLWEPGKTQIVYLAVANNGNLDLKYNIALDVIDGGLVGALEYAIIDGAKFGDITATDWAAIKGSANAQTGDVVAGTTVAAPNGAITVAEKTEYFALAVHMKEDAGNQYQDKNITIDVTVYATQLASEEDAFDNQYDKDAEFAVNVDTADELKKALGAGGNVALANDVIISESLPVTKDTVLDLNGKNIGTSGSTTGSPLYLQGGKLTVKNGTLDLDGSHTNVNGTFSAAIGYDAQTELVVENVNFTGKTAINGTFATDGPLKISISDCTMDVTNLGIAVSANSTEAIATINNCNIDADVYAIFASQGSKITINGGTYKSAGKVITSMYDNTVVTINGGSFDGELWVTSGGSLVIYGGTFTADPSAYVATGYQAVDNGDGTWTVTAL